uniref:Uracil phosphoribosyltransferase n=1 Tax=Chondria sp. (in: red algae) TaxID=1982705 RepID=A0A1Z1MEJ4_9FLOR|nr:uracil phosphoribosyltransferase [Chondria sp. (in: red algae)]
MQLNIYNISHPIIKLLSNVIKQEKQNPVISSYYYKNIGLLLIYEVLRKYINVNKVYIKLMYSTKSLHFNEKNRNYIILTDLSNNYEMLGEIKILLPKIDIIDIKDTNSNIFESYIENRKIKYKTKNTEIFILQQKLENINVIQIIKRLTLKYQAPINHINVACIISSKEILNILAYEYPKLKVYTTEII